MTLRESLVGKLNYPPIFGELFLFNFSNTKYRSLAEFHIKLNSVKRKIANGRQVFSSNICMPACKNVYTKNIVVICPKNYAIDVKELVEKSPNKIFCNSLQSILKSLGLVRKHFAPSSFVNFSSRSILDVVKMQTGISLKAFSFFI